MPKFRCLCLKPMWVANTVIFLDSSDKTHWWKPLYKSCFENTADPFSSKIMSSIDGVTWHSCFIAWFALRMSTHSLMPFGVFAFGATTKLDTHGVAPFTDSITSIFSRRSSSFSTLSLRWNGIQRGLLATGTTLSSMWNFISPSFNLPSPWNTFAYLSHKSEYCFSVADQIVGIMFNDMAVW